MYRCWLISVPYRSVAPRPIFASTPVDLIPPLRMSTAPLQSRDALVTKTTRDGTQVLLDFLAETEPPSTSSTSTIQAGERTIIQRGPSLGGLALEKAKVRLGLLSKSRKKKVEEEGPRKRQSEAWVVVKVEEEGSLRINTPPPGTVAITRNSG